MVSRILLPVLAILLPAAQPAVAEEPREPQGVITLADALGVTLVQSPELEAFSWDVRAAEARALQARRRPNPEASLQVEDVLGSGDFQGAREAQVTLQLGQLVELGGKRAARAEVAERTRAAASSEFDAKRVDVLAEATRRFVRALARQHEVAFATAALELADATVSTIARRVAAGADSPLEQKKAVTSRARARIAAEHAEHELRVARHQLAAMWGSSAPAFDRVKGDLFSTRPVPPFEALVATLADAPQIERNRADVRIREAEIRLADSKRTPDVTLQGGARWLEGPGDNAFVFGVAVPLPFADRNQGGAAEARALLRKSEASAHATEARLRALLFALYQELLHAETALEAFEREIVPGAEESLALSRDGFSRGRFSYLDLADAQRTLGEVRQQRIETAVSYHELVLEIERLLGAPLEDASTASVKRVTADRGTNDERR